MAMVDRRRRKPGFTLVELLIVVAIIGLLLAIFMPVLSMFHKRLMDTHCQTNISNIQKILFAYAQNNKSLLPGVSGSTGGQTIDGPSTGPNLTVMELKRYGASPTIFMCPAAPHYQDTSWYQWQRWESKEPSGDVSIEGYMIWTALWTGLPQNNYHRWHDYFQDGRKIPFTSDEPGNAPLISDTLAWSNWSKQFYGFYHEDGALDDGAPSGGGGYTMFLSGAIAWFDWDELAEADYQPLYPGLVSWQVDKFWMGRSPKSE